MLKVLLESLDRAEQAILAHQQFFLNQLEKARKEKKQHAQQRQEKTQEYSRVLVQECDATAGHNDKLDESGVKTVIQTRKEAEKEWQIVEVPYQQACHLEQQYQMGCEINNQLISQILKDKLKLMEIFDKGERMLKVLRKRADEVSAETEDGSVRRETLKQKEEKVKKARNKMVAAIMRKHGIRFDETYELSTQPSFIEENSSQDSLASSAGTEPYEELPPREKRPYEEDKQEQEEQEHRKLVRQGAMRLGKM